MNNKFNSAAVRREVTQIANEKRKSKQIVSKKFEYLLVAVTISLAVVIGFYCSQFIK